ncbi:ATP11-domain-containing protein [Phellopilus nigrolimitatus]|nr:ATP11-domain-containing protein [Phellopilus nigrolimitatus]
MMISALALSRCARQRALFAFLQPRPCSRNVHWSPARLNMSQKYLDKVRKRAEEQGVSVDELKETVKSAAKPTPLPEARKLQARKLDVKPNGGPTKTWTPGERRDNSPVRPLADFMDIHKVLRTPHTAEQISALWTAFHATRSSGTGRGFLSSSVPLPTYETLIQAAKKHPTFIVPLMREASQASAVDGTATQSAYEFFFLQWLFHAPHRIPAPGLLDDPLPGGLPPPPAPEHPLATVLFTPLLEYKTRTTFATPHLVLTLYPDLARSHALVLLRGELTPSPAEGGRYLLSQQDAQMLALGVQRFYLSGGAATKSTVKDEGRRERAELLRVFNESPAEFRWEDLLKHADPTS